LDDHASQFGKFAPASDAGRVKMIILHNAPRLCAWAGFERGRLRPFITVE